MMLIFFMARKHLFKTRTHSLFFKVPNYHLYILPLKVHVFEAFRVLRRAFEFINAMAKSSHVRRLDGVNVGWLKHLSGASKLHQLLYSAEQSALSCVGRRLVMQAAYVNSRS
jgi:hypothetical protein